MFPVQSNCIVFIFSSKVFSPVPAFHLSYFHWYSFNGVVSHLRCSKNMVMGGSRVLSLKRWLLGAYPGPRSSVAMVTLQLCQGWSSLWAERSSPASSYVGFWQLEGVLWNGVLLPPMGVLRAFFKIQQQLGTAEEWGQLGSSPFWFKMCLMRCLTFLTLSKSFAEDQDWNGKILAWPGSNGALEEFVLTRRGNIILRDLRDSI